MNNIRYFFQLNIFRISAFDMIMSDINIREYINRLIKMIMYANLF